MDQLVVPGTPDCGRYTVETRDMKYPRLSVLGQYEETPTVKLIVEGKMSISLIPCLTDGYKGF